MTSSHDYNKDKRNKNIKIYINNKFYPRNKASISVFDSGFLLGDGVWTGIRLHNNKLLFLKEHLNRLYNDAKTISLKIPFSKITLGKKIYSTIKINKMESDVHIRVVISRGIKSTPYQDPKFTISGPTIVVIPEYKQPNPETIEHGIKLVSVDVIRGSPDMQDHRVNSLSKFNCIQACISAKRKGGDEGLMLDPHGYVSTCNSTHFFVVKDGAVWTSTGEYCLGGVTRKNVIDICNANSIPLYEKNFTLSEVYDADEAFVTGTFAGVLPVYDIDDHELNVLGKDSLVSLIQSYYNDLVDLETSI